ncbi:hypothetical protein CTEN210_08397 [Chaetoceros tenuissimus]|uniref:Ubiquitin carboxyl-terminal hydrolase n=1 Tax=Chaetoceros tenuissimus TaxID=426638 RepID=A0AAD3CVI5_9STRA|nr:hypothetical protein CTEN210_08397 [Chaetoceros tenuissimus]
MKKAPPSLEVPSIQFVIGPVRKPPMHQEIITIEKNRIYIGNWKMPFSALSKACIEDIDAILKDNDLDNYQDDNHTPAFDGVFVLEAKDNSRVFECSFPSLSQGRAITPSDLRERDSILHFLRKLVKLYEKWEYKQTDKLKKQEQQEEEENFRKANVRKRQTYGKRSAFSRKSPYFAGSSIHPSPEDDREVDAYLDRKFAGPKQKSKRVKMLERAVLRNQYLSSDEENDDEPTATAQETPIEKEEIEVEEDMESSPVNSGNKRSLVSAGSRLKKKMRAEDNDDDSDFEFDEPSVAKKSQSIKVSVLEDEDDDDEDDDDDEKMEKDEGKDATTLLTNESKTKAPARVTPLRTSTLNSENTEQKEDIEDAVTDEEDVPDLDDTAVSSPQAEEKMGNISSFFQPKPNANDTRSPSRSTPKKILKKSKFQERRSTQNRTSFADNILQSTPTRKSNPLKLNRSPDSLQSPRKILSKSFDRANDSRRISFSPRISNPYKSVSSLSKSAYSHHKGLRNLGNTCYLNASLQVLFSLPDFLQDLGKLYSDIKSKSTDDSTESSIPICSAMLSIGKELGLISDLPGIESTGSSSADPSILKKEIDKKLPNFKGYQQQDAEEFMSRLIDILHEELAAASKDIGIDEKSLPTSTFFRLVIKLSRKCDSCGSSESSHETFNRLALEVHDRDMSDNEWSVSKSLEKYFSTEKIENFQCEECSNSTSCTRCTTIVTRPKALLVQLKRFAYDNDQMQKRSEKVAPTKDISLEKFVDEKHADETESSFMYGLTGVVFHKGRTPFSGHYTADALRRSTNSEEKEWVNFNDLATARSSFEHVNSELSQTNNYLVLYRRV